MTAMSTPMMLAASDKVRESLIAGMCLKQKPMQKQQSIIQHSLISRLSFFFSILKTFLSLIVLEPPKSFLLLSVISLVCFFNHPFFFVLHPTTSSLPFICFIENTYLNGETIRLDGALRMPPQARL